MCFRPAGSAKAIKCPRCGSFNMPTAKQCRKCGLTAEEFMEMMKQQEAAGKEQEGDKPAE